MVEDTPSALVVAVAVIRSWVRCAAFGFKTCRVHQTKATRVRDCPAFGRPTTLVWQRRRFRCNRCGATTTEGCAQFDRGLTLRFRRALYSEVIASTVNKVRKTHGLAWSVVMALVAERVTVLAAQRRRRPARVVCIDEKRLTKGHGPFSTRIYHKHLDGCRDAPRGGHPERTIPIGGRGSRGRPPPRASRRRHPREA